MTKKRSFIAADGTLLSITEEELPFTDDPFDHPDDHGPCITVEDRDGDLYWSSPHHDPQVLTSDTMWGFIEAMHYDARMHTLRYGYPTYMLPTKFRALMREVGIRVAREHWGKEAESRQK